MTTTCMLSRACAAALLVGVTAGTAGAQALGSADRQPPRPAPPVAQGGPMVVERVYSGLTIAPDFKLTRVDGSDARMAGAYGGWMIDNTLLLGAGGYWTVDESRDRDMRYGGAVVEWLQFANRPVGFSVRGLVGGGTTTLTEDIAVIQLRDRDMMMGSRYGSVIFPPPLNVSPRFRFREHFFVAEPQASVLVNFNRRIRLNVGAGYRLIGTREGFGKRLRGATGSIGLEIGVTSR